MVVFKISAWNKNVGQKRKFKLILVYTFVELLSCPSYLKVFRVNSVSQWWYFDYGLRMFTCISQTFSSDVDECMVSPCKNGGTCTDLVNSFTCKCEDGYSGHDCSLGMYIYVLSLLSQYLLLYIKVLLSRLINVKIGSL